MNEPIHASALLFAMSSFFTISFDFWTMEYVGYTYLSLDNKYKL